MTLKAPPLVSLFSGAGGLDLGFRQIGFETVAAYDSCESAVRTFNKNSKSATCTVTDLSKCTPLQIVEEIKTLGKSPKGVIGGPPCQGFSVGNVSAKADDPRNQLPYRFVGILDSLNYNFGIDFFVFENVPGLKLRKHNRRFERIKNRLCKAGFTIYEKEVNAVNFGVAQNRRRLIVVGINKILDGVVKFAFPTGYARAKTVRDVIGGLPDPVFFEHRFTQDTIPFHPNHWTMQPRSKKFTTQEFGEGRSFRRLNWNEPSHTVAYGNREIHVHPDGKRRLSIFEAMLLQGFPKSYVLEGTFSKQVEQVSNAVPPPMARAIGKSILKHLYPGRDNKGKEA